MRPLLFALALPLVGCAEVSIDVDPDGDGLADADEAAIGSDPGVPDSDGDGFLDGDEVAQHTSPIDPADAPYQAGWPIGACHNSIEPTGGTAVGDVLDNLSWPNQFGETVRLWDFCDRVVFIIFGAPW